MQAANPILECIHVSILNAIFVNVINFVFSKSRHYGKK